MPEISVVIPTLGRARLLRRVLDRLAAQEDALAALEVVVVNDPQERDPAGVEAAVGERPYPTRLLRGPRAGAAAARNAGWRAATAPVVLFLDDDVLPLRRLVAEHVAWHRARRGVEVAVLGHVRWARELRVTPFMRWLEHGIQFDYPAIEGEEAGWGRFYTANVSLKRELLERAGGFEERRLPFGYEDLDLAHRLNDLGMRLVYNRRAEAEHLHRMDLDFWRRRVERIAVSERRFVEMHPGVRPYFHDLFADAARRPPARGRAARLAPYVPPWVPGLGRRVWTSFDLVTRQALAPHFLAAWEGAATGERGPAQPDLSERLAASSGGSESGGPK